MLRQFINYVLSSFQMFLLSKGAEFKIQEFT